MKNMLTRRTIQVIITVLFFGFIIYLIVGADMDKKSILIRLADNMVLGDKIGHFLIFGTMALLLNSTLGFRRIQVLRDNMLMGSGLVLIFAILEELSQLAFESRTFDFGDMLFDILGITILGSYSFKVVAGNLYAKLAERLGTKV